jgi:aminoglycoside phosphotransferase family enzyme/predicted kinase
VIAHAPNRTLPAALLDPASYPHGPEAVELRETHISWVFLAGEKAYKVKKPVRFPFLDYGTPGRRHVFCRAEMQLNRRFAPTLYRGVVSLVPASGGRLAIAAEHDPRAVDYAVVMGRYDETVTLGARLGRGAIGDSEVLRIGTAIAGWHAAAPVERDLAGARRLAAVVEETLTTLAAAGAPERRLDALARFCRAALTAFGGVLDRRARDGRVRDGHGDLRAEHVLTGDEVAAVDGVEFDAELRIADVGYDLAFLVMDVARTDDDLARTLVRGYRAAGGDPGDDALLDFFCVVRALVRAKIDLLRAAQLDGAAAQERAARAIELLGMAERFAWRARLPRLVCVTGLAASGKSTVAEALAAAAGRPVLSSDRIRKLRAGVDPYEYAGAAAYGDAESRAVYEELAQRAGAAIRRDGGVIVDATFRRAADASAFATGARVAAEPAWIVCEAPPEVLLQRAAARAARGSVSDAGPVVVAGELAVHRGRFQPPGPPLARLETTRPISELLEELAAALDARLGGAS